MKAISKNLQGASGPSLDNRRAAAGAVDLALVVAGGAVIVLAAGGTLTGLLAVVILGWALFYYYATESAGGQTLGKRLLGLRVERQGGGEATEREIVTRTVLRIIDGIGFYLVGLVTMMVTGERRQRLGDLAAGTVVVDGSGAATPKAVSKVSTMAAAPAAPPRTSGPSTGPTLEAELFEPEPEYHPELQDEDALDAAALAEAGFFAPSDHEPDAEPEAEPHVEVEPEEDLGADLAEDESPRIEIISEAEEAEAFPSALGNDQDHGYAPEPFGADWDLGESADEEEPVAAEDAGDDDHGAMPSVSSPALAELAEDVAASAKERDPDAEPAEEPVAESDEPGASAEDDELTVKTVETVSPMDLVMGSGKHEDEDEEDAESAARPRGQSSRRRLTRLTGGPRARR